LLQALNKKIKTNVVKNRINISIYYQAIHKSLLTT
jgi:hypothetical protein